MSSSSDRLQNSFDSYEPKQELESPFLNEEFLADEARIAQWRVPATGFQPESPFLEAFEAEEATGGVEEFEEFLDKSEEEEFEDEAIGFVDYVQNFNQEVEEFYDFQPELDLSESSNGKFDEQFYLEEELSDDVAAGEFLDSAEVDNEFNFANEWETIEQYEAEEFSEFEDERLLELYDSQPNANSSKEAEKCKQAWLKFRDSFSPEVREALEMQGADMAVVVAIHQGIRDLATLTKLSFLFKWNPTYGYCYPPKKSNVKAHIDLKDERMRVKEFLSRPSLPLAQREGIKCNKIEVKLDLPKPDKVGVNITGRYELRYSLEDEDEAKAWKRKGNNWGLEGNKWPVIDLIISINQAGRHIEGIISTVRRPGDARNEERAFTKFNGDLQSDGSFLYYSTERPDIMWGYFSYESNYLYHRGLRRDKRGLDSKKRFLHKISKMPTVLDLSAFSDQGFPRQVLFYVQKPLTQHQIYQLVRNFHLFYIEPHLQKYFMTPAGNRELERQALINAALPLNRYIEEVFTHKYFGIHGNESDMFLARYYVRTILSQQKWTFKQVTRSLLDWMQIMLDVAWGNNWDLLNFRQYLGLESTVPKGINVDRAVTAAKPQHTYKVSFSLKGFLFYFSGTITVTKTSGKTWTETFNIKLKGGQVKIKAFEISETGTAGSYYDWDKPNIPGSVEFVTGQIGGMIPGVKLKAGAWFINILGSGSYPLMTATNQNLEPGLNASKKRGIDWDVVNLGGFWGEISDKPFPARDDSKFVPITDYAANIKLQDDVHFCLNSALLTEDARQALRIMCANELSALMSPNSELRITGHADRSVPPRMDEAKAKQYNQTLSELRAKNTKQAIKDILGGQLAISDNQIVPKGEGDALAAKENRPPKEVNPNYRRVDIILNSRLVLTLKAQ
jgi:outer membrane protein OmpA-like peptidoglycan-associated protein